MSSAHDLDPSRVVPEAAFARRRQISHSVLCLSTLAALVSLPACSTAPVDRSTNQTRSGVSAADRGFWEEAEFRWLKALAISQSNARALNNLAVRQERLAEFDTAKARYDDALQVAGPAERDYINWNYKQFSVIWERVNSGEIGNDDSEAASDDGDNGNDDSTQVIADELSALLLRTDLTAFEVEIALPDEGGPNLAGFSRMLIGNFVQRRDSTANINGVAVPYLRRRITQRTFFQTQDQLGLPLEGPREGIFDDADYWVQRAEAAGADLILTGEIGVTTEDESKLVRRRVRGPDGEVREVAEFEDSVTYTVNFDYVLLRGEDGQRLLDGALEGSASFPSDQGVDDGAATAEALEQLVPQILQAITPQRTDQSRLLIY